MTYIEMKRLAPYLTVVAVLVGVPGCSASHDVPDSAVPAAIKAIVGNARTGRMGDGKIIVLPCLDDYVAWSS